MIHANALHKYFRLGDQWIHALENIQVNIPEGQFATIMGPSGSGKSTLLYLIGGLDRPTEGDLIVNGQPLNRLNGEQLAAFRRHSIGFIFQAFHLVPSMTALENVALPGVFAGLPRDVREERAFRLLDRLALADRIDHKPTQLSGGQQQRVAIARALFNNPPLIVADEPTGALDSRTGQLVIQMLRTLCDKQGKTVLIVTHDEGIARQADRILRLKDGRLMTDEMISQAQPGTTVRNTSRPAMSAAAMPTQTVDVEEGEHAL